MQSNTLEFWNGRIDGTAHEQLRWHQVVQSTEKIHNFDEHFVVIGFECDEGVRRNKGRIGAKDAPDILRKCCSNFPVLHSNFQLFDDGTIRCDDHNLEHSQEQLANKVQQIHSRNGKTLVFGGGHEVTFAHFSGLRNAFPKEKIGIINFDAHFDNRKVEPTIGATSGTGFYQIAEQESLHSLTIGIQTNSNTKELFDYAHTKGMHYITAENFSTKSIETIASEVSAFIQTIDKLYVTVCMDVFSSSFAPGVSATAYNGLIPDFRFIEIFRLCTKHTSCIALDFAEVNPSLDIDNRTAKLAASLVFEAIS